MKELQVKKSKKKLPDLTKIPEDLLEKEIYRRNKIRRQKEADKAIQKMYELYQTRASCPLLGKAYLPDGFDLSYWCGLDTLKKFEIANIQFGDHGGNKHSSVKMNVPKPAYKAIRSVVDDWDKLIQDFWKETYEKFNNLVTELIEDPARIAIMIAKTADNFNLNSEESSETEIKYYNKIVKLFNDAVVERFEKYSDDILIDALRRIENGEASPGFSGSRDDSSDMLMAVLRHRGHTYKLYSEKWAEKYESSSDEDDDWDEDDDY